MHRSLYTLLPIFYLPVTGAATGMFRFYLFFCIVLLIMAVLGSSPRFFIWKEVFKKTCLIGLICLNRIRYFYFLRVFKRHNKMFFRVTQQLKSTKFRGIGKLSQNSFFFNSEIILVNVDFCCWILYFNSSKWFLKLVSKV